MTTGHGDDVFASSVINASPENSKRPTPRRTYRYECTIYDLPIAIWREMCKEMILFYCWPSCVGGRVVADGVLGFIITFAPPQYDV